MSMFFDCATPILATTTQVMRADATPNAPRENRRSLGLRPDQYGECPTSLNGCYDRSIVVCRNDDDMLREWTQFGGEFGEAAQTHLDRLLAAERRRLDAKAWSAQGPELPTSKRLRDGSWIDVDWKVYTEVVEECARRTSAVVTAQNELNQMMNGLAFLLWWSEQGEGVRNYERYVTAHAAGIAVGLDLPPLMPWVGDEMEAALEATFPGARWRLVGMANWRVVLANGRTVGWMHDSPQRALEGAGVYWSKGQEWLSNIGRSGKIRSSDWCGNPPATGCVPNVENAATLAGLLEVEVIAACAGITVEEVMAVGSNPYDALDCMEAYGRCPSGPVGPYYHWARKAA